MQKAPFIALILLAALMASCGGGKRLKTSQSNAKQPSKAMPVQQKYANLLEVPPSQLRNITLYQFIDSWSGTPYKYGGMSSSGVDCSGFVNILYDEVYKVKLERTTKAIRNKCKPVSRSAMQEGDLVFFTINGKKTAHMGVYLHNNRFVHASSSKGVVISQLQNPYYQKAYETAGRVR